MQKIIFIANESQIGGASKSLVFLAYNLKKYYEPIILVNKEGPLTNLCNEKKIKYCVINFKPFFIPNAGTKLKTFIKRLLKPLFVIQHYIINNLSLRKFGKQFNIKDIFLVHTNVNRDDFGAMISKKYNIPHIWHLREFGDSDYKGYFLRSNYIDYMNKNTTFFIAISEAIKKNFLKKGLSSKKIYVIYNGVKIKNDVVFNNEKNLKIIFMGGIQESKGQLELIESLKLIPKDILKNITVDFYGHGIKKYVNLLNQKINTYNLENIHIYNYTNNIEKILKNYNVGIMCSKNEAFGRVTVEYMSNKLITIASNKGACPEIITTGTGFLYEYGNYADLANIIKKIYNMSLIDREIIVNKGYERAKFFSDKKNAQEILKLYKKILTRRKFK